MNIGDRVKMQPVTFGVGDMGLGKQRGAVERKKTYPGTVTYIHPTGRWYCVTFDNGIKECFFAAVEPTPLVRDKVIHHGPWV